jgi:hypothetical protein
VEKLDTLLTNVLIPRRIVMMKKPITLKREKLETRIISTRKRRTFTPKKTIVHLA